MFRAGWGCFEMFGDSHRFLEMLKKGFVSEVEFIARKYNLTCSSESMRCIGYRQAYFFYILGILLLLLVVFFGISSSGSKRWINLFIMNLQPSELMKIAIIVCFSRYYHRIQSSDILFDIPMIFVGLTALSLDIKTKF